MDPAAATRIEELRARVKADPRSRLFYPLAEELRKSGQIVEAEEFLLNGLAANPTYLAAWVSLGRVLRDAGKFEPAVDALAKALTIDRENVVAARLLAETHLTLGNKVEAIKKFKLVHALLPLDQDVEAQIAQLHRELNPPTVSLAEPEPEPLMASQPEPEPLMASQPQPAGLFTVDAGVPVSDSASEEGESPFGIEAAGTSEQPSNTVAFDATIDLPAYRPDDDHSLSSGSPASATPFGGEPAESSDEFSESPFFDSAEEVSSPAQSLDANPFAMAEEDTGGFTPSSAQEVPTAPAMVGDSFVNAVDTDALSHGFGAPSMDLRDSESAFSDDEELPLDDEAVSSSEPPSELTSTLTMAELYERQGHKDAAREIYGRILERDPSREDLRRRMDVLGQSEPSADDSRAATVQRLESWLSRVRGGRDARI